MSVENEILEALSGDMALITLLGEGDRIINGNLKKKIQQTPPLILVETLCGVPEIIGEEGILADSWSCCIWIIVEGSTTAMEEEVKRILEKIGFTMEMMNRVNEDRPELTCIELKFNGFRIRQ